MAMTPIRDPDWRRRRLEPWAGLVLGGAAWAISHQFGSDLVQDDCRWGQPGVMAIIGILALLVAAFGAWVSLRLWFGSKSDPALPDEGTVRFIGAVSGLSAILFAFAVLAQMLGGLIIPTCAA